jgi:uncharacterized protein
MAPEWLVLGSALLAGLLGSAHCAAMCGGIASGFAAIQPRMTLLDALEPNIGRLLGYVTAGAAAGGLGHGVLGIFNMPGLGMTLRAAVGAVLIVAALRLLDRRGHLAFVSAPGKFLYAWLRPLHRHVLPANTSTRRLLAGVLWGWLPCGLSTTVLLAAWFQASALGGAMTMLAFGAGTLPAMISLTWTGARIGQWLRRGQFRTAAGLMVLLSGSLTLLAPWLSAVPTLHRLLQALGCRSLT